MKAVTVSLLSHCQHTIYRGMGRRELSYREWGGGSCPTGNREEGALLQGMGRRELSYREWGGGSTVIQRKGEERGQPYTI